MRPLVTSNHSQEAKRDDLPSTHFVLFIQSGASAHGMLLATFRESSLLS